MGSEEHMCVKKTLCVLINNTLASQFGEPQFAKNPSVKAQQRIQTPNLSFS